MSSSRLRVLHGRKGLAPRPPSRTWPATRLFGTVVRSRLVHFLLLGGLIFAVAPRPEPRRDIAFDTAAFDDLQRAQAQRLGVPVLEARDAEEVRTRAIEDEILYREALRLGFDKDDNVVRQRLVQKVLFLAEDLAGRPRRTQAGPVTLRHAWLRPVHDGLRRRDRQPRWHDGQRR